MSTRSLNSLFIFKKLNSCYSDFKEFHTTSLKSPRINRQIQIRNFADFVEYKLDYLSLSHMIHGCSYFV